MIWLFKVDEVFWGNKPKIDKHYVFDTNDFDFDINRYDISLYFGTANYYLLNETNDTEVYWLRFIGVNKNPTRVLVSDKSKIYDIVRNYYINKNQKKLIEKIKSKFGRKPLLVIPDVRSLNSDEDVITWGKIFDDMKTSPYIDIEQVRDCDRIAILSWLSSNFNAPIKKDKQQWD